jgi:hypothetical protein
MALNNNEDDLKTIEKAGINYEYLKRGHIGMKQKIREWHP